jgi:hypothetical protein
VLSIGPCYQRGVFAAAPAGRFELTLMSEPSANPAANAAPKDILARKV